MFAKIFTQIFDSSIADDWQTRLVFEDLLKLCDVNGVVDMTHEAISRRTGVPQDIVNRGITELEKPDPRSRNPENEGRRIIRLDSHRQWGWHVVNYAHYRAIASEDQRRESGRLRTERFRARQGNAPVTRSDAPVTRSDAGNAMQKQKQKQMEAHIEQGVRAIIIPASERPDGIELSLGEVVAFGAFNSIPEDKCRAWFEHVKIWRPKKWKSGLRLSHNRDCKRKLDQLGPGRGF